MGTSTAYLLIRDRGWKYTFDGVTSIAHTMTLKVETDSDSSLGSDYINNARNEPDVVTLSVVTSDVNAGVENWSAQLLRALAAVKENRLLCQVVTSLRTYDAMLLTEFSALQDETCPGGWMGTLTFTKVQPTSAATQEIKTENNASTPVNSGYAAAGGGGGGGKSGYSGSTFQTILREAGIKGV